VKGLPSPGADPSARPPRGTLGSVAVFGLVGLSGIVLQYALLFALVGRTDAPVVVISTIGAILGAILVFLLNHLVTFASIAPVARPGSRYAVLAVLSICNNAVLMFVFASLLHWSPWASQLSSTAIVFIANYLLSRFWVFR
jgi:putative flippase GtrA